MVKIEGRKVEVQPDEILVGNVAHPRFITPPVFPKRIDANCFVLNTWDDENSALSGSRMFNGFGFDLMAKKALGGGQFLARVRDVTPLLRDINRALRGEGVICDASGNLVECDKLTELGDFINNTSVFLNDTFVEGSGFNGVDVIHLVGMDREGSWIVERQPLEKYFLGLANVRGKMNSQGYFTQKAPVEKFERGKTIYQHAPVAGRVAGLNTNSYRADLYANLNRKNRKHSYPPGGGILRVECTAPK